MRKAKIYFELTRPRNNLIAALAVLVGALVSYPVESVLKLTLACFSAGLISAGGYVINDYFDLDTDRVNKPQRPLPRGELSRKSALNFSLLLSGAGVALSVFIKSSSLAVASVSVFLLFLYSSKLKRELFVGNVVVSLICAFAFLYGGLVGSNFILSFIPAGFAFLFHLGREILKDAEDLKGDLLINAQTIPIVLGKRIGGAKATAALEDITLKELILRAIAEYIEKRKGGE